MKLIIEIYTEYLTYLENEKDYAIISVINCVQDVMRHSKDFKVLRETLMCYPLRFEYRIELYEPERLDTIIEGLAKKLFWRGDITKIKVLTLKRELYKEVINHDRGIPPRPDFG